MPTEKIIEFILFIIPGFLAIEIYRSIYPAKPISDFSKISWSVIYSVLIYTGVRWADDRLFHGFLHSTSSEFPNMKFTLALFVVALILGGCRSILHRIRFILGSKYKLFKRFKPDPQSIWNKINQETTRDWSVVYLDDGAIYLGYIAEYTFDPSSDSQDFLLSGAKRVDQTLKEIYIIDGIGVYLNTRDVKRIEFFRGK